MKQTCREEIAALVHGYADAIDAGDFDALGRLFAHGTWNSRRGEAEAVDYLRRNVIIYADGTPRTAHHVTNLQIELSSPDRAEARSRIMVLQQVDPDGPIVTIASLDYRDWFWRPDGAWAFLHRDVTLRFGDLSRHLRQAPPEPTSGGVAPDVW